MPLSKSQKAMVHMAKAACRLDDAEYRECWATLFPGVTSSADTGLGDEHFDKFMKYLEAIYWHLRLAGKAEWSKVFQRPHYWAEKNTSVSTSRERHNLSAIQAEVKDLEQQLMRLGFGHAYCNAIAKKVLPASPQVTDWFKLRNALSRTLANKLKQAEEKEVVCPF
jgi:hypothetical protein